MSHLTRTFERAAAKKWLRLSLTSEPARARSRRSTSRPPSPCRRGGNPEIVPSPACARSAGKAGGAAGREVLPRGAAPPGQPPCAPLRSAGAGRPRCRRAGRRGETGAAPAAKGSYANSGLAQFATEAELLPKTGWGKTRQKLYCPPEVVPSAPALL